jgi:hypothetical protein
MLREWDVEMEGKDSAAEQWMDYGLTKRFNVL